jgi:O-acetyl-ADP-ribose deacetylase (regulator of RNase III)
VIHTVGPVWRDGHHHEEELLASCYRSCFALVEQRGIETVAFPSLSTGAYGFPMERAAGIALRETKNFLQQNRSVQKVMLVCHGARALAVHETAFREVCI